jgi:hypothetical protein
LDHTQPFLFDGRMKGDGERRGTQADKRRANTGAIVVQPDGASRRASDRQRRAVDGLRVQGRAG